MFEASPAFSCFLYPSYLATFLKSKDLEYVSTSDVFSHLYNLHPPIWLIRDRQEIGFLLEASKKRIRLRRRRRRRVKTLVNMWGGKSEGRCHDMQTLDCVRKSTNIWMRLLVAWLASTQAITLQINFISGKTEGTKKICVPPLPRSAYPHSSHLLLFSVFRCATI